VICDEAGIYLTEEMPIVAHRMLARAFGLDRAVMIQQVAYWMKINRDLRRQTHYMHGRWWVFNTVDQWHAAFPWLSRRTMVRIISDLEDRGVLISIKPRSNRMDHTKWYSLHDERLAELMMEARQRWLADPDNPEKATPAD
jgi:hypothetical protein